MSKESWCTAYANRRLDYRALATIAALACGSSAVADVRYVDASIAVNGNGLAWNTAYKTLQAALTAASSNPAITEIWVADGVYKPSLRLDPSDIRSVTFKLKNGLALYGGFAGGETSLAQRNPAVNVATLSGDIGVVGVNTDNAYHVVYSLLNSNTAVLDGFTVRDGYAENFSNGGGGIYLSESATIVRSTTFTSNFAITDGGAIKIQNGTAPTFIDCVVSNSGGGEGPAVRSFANGTIFDGCTFANNTLRGAVELWTNASTQFIDCTFTGNGHSQGASWSALHSLAPAVTLLHCTFTNNGPGRACEIVGEVTIEDCTFTGNTSGGLSLANIPSTTLVRDCVFDNNGELSSVHGGGIAGGFAILEHCTFTNNKALIGGGVYGDFAMVDCDLVGNSAFAGGAISQGSGTYLNTRFAGNTADTGGAVRFSSSGPASFVQCLFTANQATSVAGAVLISGQGVISFEGCAFVGNSGPWTGGILVATSASPTSVKNSIFWGNTSTSGTTEQQQLKNTGPEGIAVSSSTVEGWSGALGGANNNGLDPLLSAIAGSDTILGTIDDDPTPDAGSPAIDSANASLLSPDTYDIDHDGNTAEPLPLDLLGHGRVLVGGLDRGPVERDPDAANGLYIGPPGGSWFVAAHWAGGAVPSAATDVIIRSSVTIDAPGAEAKTVTIQGGGTLTLDAAGASLACISLDNQGTLDLLEGSLAVSESLTSGSSLTWGCVGAVTVTIDDATIAAPSIVICANGALSGSGEIVGDLTNHGSIDPSGGSRTVVVGGAFVQSASGSLHLDLIDGLYGTASDLLLLDGPSATIDGAAIIGIDTAVAEPSLHTLIDGPVATTGTFASLILPPAAGEFLFSGSFIGGNLTVTAASSVPFGSRCYVRTDASPLATGTSWANAIASLDTAITIAASNGSITEIWVAEGTYVPTVDGTPSGEPSGPRAASFRLLPGVALRGGFAGTETLASERDIAAHPTILDGDLGGNDDGSDNSKTDNAYSVVTAVNVSPAPTLDGVVVRHGYANGSPPAGEDGGGIRIVNTDLLLTNTTIEACGGGDGAIMRIASSDVVVTDSNFHGNGGQLGPAGISLVSGSLSLTGSTISNNLSSSGGEEGSAIRQTGGVLTLTDCTIAGNQRTAIRIEGTPFSSPNATFDTCSIALNGTGAVDAGAILVNESAIVHLTGCLFQSNSAVNGGAVGVYNGATVTIDTCTFEDNTATFTGGAITVSDAEPTISNCIFTANTAHTGGAIAVLDQLGNDASVTLADCTFASNSAIDPGPADGLGGAVSIIGGLAGATPLLDQCTFTGNVSEVGGGLYLQNVNASVDTSSFDGNSATSGSGIALQFFGRVSGNPILTGNDEISTTDDVAPASPLAGTLPTIGTLTADRFTLRNRGIGYEDRPRLLIELGGLFAGTQHDLVDASAGTATLRGTLNVTLTNGFVPAAGDSFRVVEAGKRVGAFDVALFAAIPDGLALTVTHDDEGVLLELGRLGAAIEFADPTSDPLVGTPVDAVADDFDGDGDIDVVVLLNQGGDAALSYLENQGTSGSTWLGFAAPTALTAPADGPVDLASGDLNGDGLPDLVVLTNVIDQVAVALATGSSTTPFASPTTTSLPTDGGGVAIVRGSGPPDLYVTVPSTGHARRLINSGSGSFSLGGLVASVSGLTHAIGVDLDGDGDDELVGGSSGGVIAVHRQTARATFASPASYPTGSSALELTAGDIDGDGAPDIAFTASAGVGVLRNLDLGDAALSNAGLIAAGSGCESPSLLDALDDGDLDIAFVDLTGAASIVRNDGSAGTVVLTQVNGVPSPAAASRAVAADLNGDGLTDLLLLGLAPGVAGLNGDATVLLSQGTQTLPGDLNGDGLVNAKDLALLLGAWATSSPTADLDGSGLVDAADLAILLGSWS